MKVREHLNFSKAESIKSVSYTHLFRLYQLIWKRFAASRMQPARYETTAVKIGAGKYVFTVTTSKIAFQGFRSVYTEADEEKEENNVLVGGLKEDSRLEKEEFDAKQHFTQPPAHYTEATLVKALEELGIGRPSTYAPTISTILGRRYITKEAKNLYITCLLYTSKVSGRFGQVSDLLLISFEVFSMLFMQVYQNACV